MYEKLGFFINGEWRTGSGKGEDVLNPANESVLAFLPHASQKDLEDALSGLPCSKVMILAICSLRSSIKSAVF